MAKDLISTVSSPVAKVIFATDEGAVQKSIVIAPAQNEVNPGDLLVRDGNGHYKPAAAADIVAGKDICVALETVDTSEETTQGMLANAGFRGVLVRENLKVTGGAEITDAMLLTLRGLGFDTRVHVPAEDAPTEKDITM